MGTVVWNLNREREPFFEGKPLSWWMLPHDGYPPNYNMEVEEPISRAVGALGTNTIPCLLKWIAYAPPPEWRSKIGDRVAKLPRTLGSEKVAWWFDGMRGCALSQGAVDAFRVLGSAAAPAAPELIRIAENADSEMAQFQARSALVHIGEPTTPALLAAYSRAVETNRTMIAICLNEIWNISTNGPDHGFITNFFIHPDALVRQGATNFTLSHAPELLTNAPPR